MPVELLLDLELELLPMTITHRLIAEPCKEWDSVQEGVNTVVEVLRNVPLLLFLGQLANLELDLGGDFLHLLHVEMIEVNGLPLLPVVVPFLFDVPNVEKRSVFLLDTSKILVLIRLHLEDFEANLHILFQLTQFFAIHLELDDCLERLLVIVRLEVFNKFLGSHVIELLAVLSDKALELLHIVLHALLKGLLALVDDVLGLSHAESEVLPFLVDVEEQVLVILSQLELTSANIRELIVHDELELLLDWIDLALELRAAVVDLLPLVLVLLELLLVLALLGEFLHGVFQLVDKIAELTLRFLNQVTKDLSDRGVALFVELSL